MRFVDRCLKARGRSREDLSVAIGANTEYLAVCAQRQHWYPGREMAERIAAELEIEFEELRRDLDGLDQEYRNEIWRLKIQVQRLAQNADRAAGYEATIFGYWAREAVRVGDAGKLTALRDGLLGVPREGRPNPSAGRKLAGRRRPEAVRRKMSVALKARFAMLSPGQRRAKVAHLHTPAMRIRDTAGSVVGRKGIDYMRDHIGDYVQWAVRKYGEQGINENLARYIINEAVKPASGRGRTADYDHPHICTLSNSVSWASIGKDALGANSVRMAHTQWHERKGLTRCPGMLGRSLVQQIPPR